MKNIGNFVRILRHWGEEEDRIKPEIYRVVECQKGEPNPQVMLKNLINEEIVASPTAFSGIGFPKYAILSLDKAAAYLDECHRAHVLIERYLLGLQNVSQSVEHQCLLALNKLAQSAR